MNVRTNLAAAVTSTLLYVSGAHATNASEQRFLGESIQSNLAEIKIGKLAQQKGASQGVRSFGATLANDHAMANNKARRTARNLGVAPPKGPSMMQRAMYMELAALSGDEFDSHFISSMVNDHQDDITKYEQEANSGAGAAAEYAKQTLPDLRKHLEIAQHLQQEQKTSSKLQSSSVQAGR